MESDTKKDTIKDTIGKQKLFSKRNLIIGLVIIICAAWGANSYFKKPKQAARPPIAVTMAKVEKRDMPAQVEATGYVEAFNSASIYPQVTGRIVGVHYKEGQDVKKGDLLVTIDPIPYRQKLSQANAQLVRDRENANFAQVSAGRMNTLFQQGAISKQSMDQANTSMYTAVATVDQSQALAEAAALDLEHCFIKSPIDGKAGAILANVGAQANAGSSQTQLVVINQIAPIFVRFTVPEKYLPDIRRAYAQRPLKVTALIPEQKEAISDGVLKFINNTVDMSTGAVAMKAEFPNATSELWPGQFVRTTLILDMQKDALIVPSNAVSIGQNGKYVFVVKADSTVESRIVEVDRIIDGMAVVTKGLDDNETVVLDGQVNLRTGSKVYAKDASVGK